MAKLCQIVAVTTGKKSRLKKERDLIYKQIQKASLFDGLTRTYRPLNEDGETFPPEKKNIQYSLKEAIDAFSEVMTDLLDCTATQDYANCEAKADIKVDGKVIKEQVPVTHLMFLEKQLVDIQTFLSHLPTLDLAETWKWDEAAACFKSEPSTSNKTKKVMKNHVKAEATDKHPAQVEVFTEDVKIGEWTTIKFSGAIPVQKKNLMLARVRQLIEAVKSAREEANQLNVTPVKIGREIWDFITRTAV